MTKRKRTVAALPLVCMLAALLVVPAAGKDIPAQLPMPDNTPPNTSEPVKVYIMMAQSNMVGFGRVAGKNTNGTLAYLTKVEKKFSNLVDDAANCNVRNDVWCVKTTVGPKQGWLQPGFGARGDFFGPELGFGHVMGWYHDEMVLLIKASQGNRSLR